MRVCKSFNRPMGPFVLSVKIISWFVLGALCRTLYWGVRIGCVCTSAGVIGISVSYLEEKINRKCPIILWERLLSSYR